MNGPVVMHILTCHICGKEKKSTSYEHAIYLLTFHLDRRHRGWTNQAAAASEVDA